MNHTSATTDVPTAAMARGSVGTVTWPDGRQLTVVIRPARNQYICDHCMEPIWEGEWHGAGRGFHVCGSHCEPIPPAVRQRQLAERAALASSLEDALAQQLQGAGLPKPMRQEQLTPGRKWRWDFVWTRPRPICLDVQGGTWQAGRHTRGQGYRDDCEKANWASRNGWVVLRFTGDQVTDGTALQTIEAVLSDDAAPAPAPAAREETT